MSRNTLDTDLLTIRQVNAFTTNNENIPALRTLTSDGKGGTYWAIPASLGGVPAFNEVIADNTSLKALNPLNSLSISTGQGLASVIDVNRNLLTLYSKGFDTLDISGGNTIRALSNSLLSNTINFVGRNGVRITGDPFTRTLFFETLATTTTPPIYGFSHVNVISNSSNIDPSVLLSPDHIQISADSTDSRIHLVGAGDIVLKSDFANKAVYISISTFNSSNYLALSTIAYNSYASTLSTVSSLFCDKSTNIQSISSLSSYTGLALSNLSTSIDRRIEFGENNVMNNYAQRGFVETLKDTLKYYVYNTTSFTSSINITDFKGLYNGIVTPNNHITVSTAKFRLDSMSSFTPLGHEGQYVFTYSPSLLYNFTMTTNSLMTLSTFLMAGSNIIPDSTFVRHWNFRIASSNLLYTDTMKFTVNQHTIHEHLLSTFAIYHRLESSDARYSDTINESSINNYTHANTLTVNLTGVFSRDNFNYEINRI
jgi:hypothetical protein